MTRQDDPQANTQEQFNRLIEFRQALYERFLTARKDAQFELMDALLSKGKVPSFAWLALAGCFQRQWSSLYDAVEQGEQDVTGLGQFLMEQVPRVGIQFWSLDGTGWPRPQARSLADRLYVYAPGRGFKGKPVVPGYSYSLLDWVPEAGESWSLSVASERVSPDSSDLVVGAAQVKRLCEIRAGFDSLDIVAGDCKYSQPEFLRRVQPLACGKVARLAKNRVLYGRPDPRPAGTRGRPRKHGARFAFKEPESWGEPVEVLELEDPKWGQVKLRRWSHLHTRSAADVEFDVVQVQVHLERDHPPPPLWLLWLPPERIPPTLTVTVETVWRAYAHRWPIEPGNRFRKQTLNWTRPQFQTAQAGDRWTVIVSLAFWQLFLARPLVADCPLPWQPKQVNLTPARVQQGMLDIFGQIGSPTRPPQTRGKSPGWPKGKPRQRKERYPVVKKTSRSPKTAKKAA
jgi:hypothetical protein